MSNHSQPDITVAVMSYNNAAYIGETVESVLAQTGVSFELIVLDDCSSDDSVKILERYSGDPRFRFEVNPQNLGMMGNYNRCLEIGSGRYVVVLGSDDLIYPGHLESLFSALELHPEVPLAYTQCNWIDENGKLLRYADHPGHAPHSYFGGRDEVLDLLRHDNYITPSAIMLRRSIFDRIRLPDGHVHYMDMVAGDWELWTRIARSFPDFAFLRQATVGYRIHGGQVSQSFYASEKPLAEHTRILELNLADEAVRTRAAAEPDGIWRLYQSRLDAFPQAITEKYRERANAIRAALHPGATLRMRPDVPFFSVVLTTYNRPQLLVFALRSLAEQRFRDFEVILVNDHGDPVESVLGEFDFPITYIYKGRNEGLSAARNTALSVAEGRFVTYLDDDDLYLPDHLALLAQTFELQPQCVAYTGVEYVNERLEEGKRVELSRSDPFAHEVFDRERLFIQNYIPVNTWAHPRALLADVGEFDTGLTAFEDWDMLLRLAARYPFVRLPQVTAEVHLRDAPNTGSDHMLGREQKNFGGLYQELYRRHSDLGSDAVRRGRHEMLQRFGIAGASTTRTANLAEWLQRRSLSTTQKLLVEERLQDQGGAPVYGMLVLDLSGDSASVAASLATLEGPHNSYERIQPVLLTVDLDVAPDFKGQIVKVTAEDWIGTVNSLVAESSFDWLALITAGDELTANGLLIASLELLTAPECRAIYCDSLYRQPDGSLGAAFLPAFNLDYLLSFPAGMGRNWLFRRDVLLQAGGFDARYSQAPEFELVLRLITQGGLAGLGQVAEPLLITDPPRVVDVEDEKRAIVEHLLARGYEQPEVRSDMPGHYRVRYGHPQQPLVSLLILAGDQLPRLQRCVESLLETTGYPRYELLLIERDDTTPEVREWLHALEGLGEERVRTIRPGAAKASVSAALNAAASRARGDYLLLLSPDTAVIDREWLDELLNHAQRPEVGVVGGKLLGRDGKVQHAGLILGLEGPVGRPFVGQAVDAPGYMQRLQVDQDYSAVSLDCLMIPRDLHEALGGLAEDVPERYLDADLCLRARQAGYLTVWAAHAKLMLDGEAPSVASAEENDALYEKWLPVLARDPAYNPNFSLAQPGGFKLADTALSWRPLSSWKPLPTVLAHPADQFGCGHYRVMQPFAALQQAGMVDGALSMGLMHVTDLERYAPDTIVLQRQIGDERLEAMRRMKAFSGAFKVYELDDYLLNLPMKSAHRQHMPKDILKSLRRGLGFVDRFVVSTQPLAEAFAGMHDDILVVENRLPVGWWQGLQGQRRASAKPRVGWAGGSSHTGDLELIEDVVKELANEVEWVFFGMCPESMRPYVHEFHPGVAIEQYPAALARLNLDLALAPVEENLFNECKSNLRLLEYGACGFPVICSDIRCYQGDLPVTRVKNRFKDWVEAIRMHLADLDATARMGDELQAVVRRDWMLEGRNLELWLKGWTPGSH
ncbi:glycosyltransferase [Pseudomonas sp. BN411]|uniref:glycosyltransferase n=1 Tax=Pseudomonas sp. BN411 TaxID=2567887 RepID=UPI002455FB3F|nr:glycosyltransferase [Pseudomonas sp. BN411]MDH4562702.1 glycosyltransferase [Pseudomonas sp. BN411]